MDGAVVVDKDLTRILRANFHLNPDATLQLQKQALVTVLLLA